MIEVTGIDHIYIAVSDLAVSEQFYNLVLVHAPGFRKNTFALDDEPHIQYACRHFGFVLRPASRPNMSHILPASIHFCFRVHSAAEVEEAAKNLCAAGIQATQPRLYPEYAPDYVATFFEDPDGVRLEVANYRKNRRERHDNWYKTAG
jgi:glyoxylase I family protein